MTNDLTVPSKDQAVDALADFGVQPGDGLIGLIDLGDFKLAVTRALAQDIIYRLQEAIARDDAAAIKRHEQDAINRRAKAQELGAALWDMFEEVSRNRPEKHRRALELACYRIMAERTGLSVPTIDCHMIVQKRIRYPKPIPKKR
jgi:hypothetical protein